MVSDHHEDDFVMRCGARTCQVAAGEPKGLGETRAPVKREVHCTECEPSSPLHPEGPGLCVTEDRRGTSALRERYFFFEFDGG